MPTMPELRVSGLKPRKFAELERRARELGMRPEEYAKQLIEDGLAIQREARSTPLNALLSSFRQEAASVSDAELDALVDHARTRHHKTARGRK
ncbi:MAG TPA: hypothetical protein VLJ39_22635 [Tepidisphaeraceae bacterium]|jgi:hypothetical protein|nr:hypothetical protein [Tepidisphaeraceae bacterium]